MSLYVFSYLTKERLYHKCYSSSLKIYFCDIYSNKILFNQYKLSLASKIFSNKNFHDKVIDKFAHQILKFLVNAGFQLFNY